jgi:hypothetical protein
MSRATPLFPAQPATPSQGTRRVFMMQLAAGGCMALVGAPALAQRRVEETDENAVQLGYKHDTTKVDKAKFPQHDNAQKCVNCSFWQGEKTDEWAGCSMFGRKQINANGWCVAWRKA